MAQTVTVRFKPEIIKQLDILAKTTHLKKLNTL